MICQQCKDAGITSTVYAGPEYTTDSYSPPFYDADGKRHHHDMNVTTTEYSCSNGHAWQKTAGATCWCGWPDQDSFLISSSETTEELRWQVAEKMRYLVIVDPAYNVTFADDLTMDEAKILLRRWAIALAKISAAQAEASREIK